MVAQKSLPANRFILRLNSISVFAAAEDLQSTSGFLTSVARCLCIHSILIPSVMLLGKKPNTAISSAFLKKEEKFFTLTNSQISPVLKLPTSFLSHLFSLVFLHSLSLLLVLGGTRRRRCKEENPYISQSQFCLLPKLNRLSHCRRKVFYLALPSLLSTSKNILLSNPAGIARWLLPCSSGLDC